MIPWKVLFLRYHFIAIGVFQGSRFRIVRSHSIHGQKEGRKEPCTLNGEGIALRGVPRSVDSIIEIDIWPVAHKRTRVRNANEALLNLKHLIRAVRPLAMTPTIPMINDVT